MTSKIFALFFAFVLMTWVSSAQAQNYRAYHRQQRMDDAYYHGASGVYRQFDDPYCNDAAAFNPNWAYRADNRRDRWGNRPVQRRIYRRPANFCQPAPVVVYQAPVYCSPRTRVILGGRPRVNINIGF